jgi:hypothetical protein
MDGWSDNRQGLKALNASSPDGFHPRPKQTPGCSHNVSVRAEKAAKRKRFAAPVDDPPIGLPLTGYGEFGWGLDTVRISTIDQERKTSAFLRPGLIRCGQMVI